MTLHQSTTQSRHAQDARAAVLRLQRRETERAEQAQRCPWPMGCETAIDEGTDDDGEVFEVYCHDEEFERSVYERHYHTVYVNVDGTSCTGDSEFLDDVEEEADWECGNGHYVNEPAMIQWLERNKR